MGRAPCCSKVGLHRGPWTPREDTLLTKYIQAHGEGNWRSLPKEAGLLRCGKSCRLRWMNYLRPDIKRGNIAPDEDDLIIRLHSLLGNRWSLIAGRLPGRTDNEIKNYWNTHLSKKLRSEGSNPNTKKKSSERVQDWKKKKNNKPNNNNNKKKQKNKKNNPNVETEKPKIHQPKPVRVTSFSLPRNESFESSRSSHGDYQDHHNVGGVIPWTNNFNGVRFFIRDDDNNHDQDQDHDHLIINGSDFECQSYVPTTDNSTLDKLYEEYLQLLKTEEDQVQLDSFAESLLI